MRTRTNARSSNKHTLKAKLQASCQGDCRCGSQVGAGPEDIRGDRRVTAEQLWLQNLFLVEDFPETALYAFLYCLSVQHFS